MKATKALASFCLLLGCTLATACSDGGVGSPTSPLVYPIMIITNTWSEASEPAHSFSLFSEDDGKMEGTIEGDEMLPDFSSFNVTGSWRNGVVLLMTERLPGTTFRASFTQDSPNRLEFSTASGETVILVRD